MPRSTCTGNRRPPRRAPDLPRAHPRRPSGIRRSSDLLVIGTRSGIVCCRRHWPHHWWPASRFNSYFEHFIIAGTMAHWQSTPLSWRHPWRKSMLTSRPTGTVYTLLRPNTIRWQPNRKPSALPDKLYDVLAGTRCWKEELGTFSVVCGKTNTCSEQNIV